VKDKEVYVKLLLRILIIILLNLSNVQAWAISITAPKEDEVFYAGSTFDIVVKPDKGEEWNKVFYSIYPMDYSFLFNEYKAKARIPADLVGYQELPVAAIDKSGRVVELKRKIFIKLPVNVTLTSIMVGQDFMLVYKMIAGSSPDDMQRIESRQLSVTGSYSDGVKREITSSASGTIYTSSDETIVTVSKDGKVTARGLGEAKITVRNGKYSAQIDIDVEPYRKPQR
jgi:hypothetical protein